MWEEWRGRDASIWHPHSRSSWEIRGQTGRFVSGIHFPSAAEAGIIWWCFSARLKPCPSRSWWIVPCQVAPAERLLGLKPVCIVELYAALKAPLFHVTVRAVAARLEAGPFQNWRCFLARLKPCPSRSKSESKSESRSKSKATDRSVRPTRSKFPPCLRKRRGDKDGAPHHSLGCRKARPYSVVGLSLLLIIILADSCAQPFRYKNTSFT